MQKSSKFRILSLIVLLVLGAAPAAMASVGSWIEINEGQADRAVSALARDGKNLMLMQPHRTRIVMPLTDSQPVVDIEPKPKNDNQRVMLELLLHGANPEAAVEPGELRGGQSRYFKGQQSDAWLDNVRHYESVRFVDVYPGIDLVYRMRGARIEYDFVVERNADLSLIRLELAGVESTWFADNGDWVSTTPAGEFRQRAPEVFAVSKAGQQVVAGRFLANENGVGFSVDANTADSPLIIDPVVEFSGYLGGSADEAGSSSALRPNGNLVLSGVTESTDIPGTPPGTIVSARDIYVAEIDRATGALLWINYIGGSGDDASDSIKLDSQGNIVAVGYTDSADFPAVNAFQSVFIGNDSDDPAFDNDAVVFKFSANGGTLVFSTYYGGADLSLDGPTDLLGFEWFRGLEIDAQDNIYAIGQTASFDFPVTDVFLGRSCLQSELNALVFFVSDIALVKFAPDGTREFATCIGGTERDAGRGLAIGPNGNVYVGGFGRSSDLPTSADAFQAVPPEELSYTAFVLKLNATMDDIDWGTYVGGNGYEVMQEIAVDDDGFVYGSGSTDSTDFPLTSNAIQSLLNLSFLPEPNSGIYDAFMFKLEPDGTDLAFSTYLGGSGVDVANATRIDNRGRIYVAGYTESRNMLLRTPVQDVPGPFFGAASPIEPSSRISALSHGGVMLPNGEFAAGLHLARDGVNQFYYRLGDNTGFIDLGMTETDSRDAVASGSGVVFVNSFGANRRFEQDFVNGGYVLDYEFGDLTADSRAGAPLFFGGNERDMVIANFGRANEIYVGTSGVTVDFGRPDGRTVDVLNLNFSNDLVFANEGQDIRLYKYNFANGTYGPPIILDANPDDVTTLENGDLDGDGWDDVIIGRNGAPLQVVFFPGGNPVPAVEVPDSSAATLSLVVADVDADSDLDLFSGNEGSDQLFFNAGNGLLERDTLFAPPAIPTVAGIYGDELFLSVDGTLNRYTRAISDIYVSVIDTNSGTLEFATYLDGHGEESMFRGMTLLDGGKLLLTGTTDGQGWPVVGAAQTTAGGAKDAVFMVLDLDIDDDHVLDGSDNCLEVANPEQRDTDNDAYGNFCDADFNNDNFVNFADLQVMKERFFTDDPDADLDGDGVVNFPDLALMKQLFFLAPGPSGLLLP